MSKLYDNAKIKLSRKFDDYEKWSVHVTGIQPGGKMGEGKFVKTSKDAVAPFKIHESDIGWDITIIRLIKQIGNVYFFGTGLKVCPPNGSYYEIVPRSSITKTGYILKNSVGVLDPSYVGEVIVCLEKTDPNAPDLELPCRIVQLVQREIIPCTFFEVESFEETARGEGGFGSTGR
jgi:dUTP pyrophosphatase